MDKPKCWGIIQKKNQTELVSQQTFRYGTGIHESGQTEISNNEESHHPLT